MARFRLHLHTNIHTVFAFGDRLSVESLTQAIPGCVVRELSSVGLGHPVFIDAELSRPTREQALDELLAAAQTLGYTVVDGEIAEAVNVTVESMAAGALGGFGLGAAFSNPLLAIVLAGVGMAAGDWVSNELANHEVVYHFRRVQPSGWQITEVPLQREPPLAQFVRRLVLS
jgi:hypothetical protein